MGKRFWAIVVGLLALPLAIASCGGTSEDDAGGDSATDPARGAVEESVDADREPPEGDGQGEVSFAGERQVIFETRLELSAENVTERYHEVSDIARRAGGYVADSRLSSTERHDHEPEARVAIRVPTERREDVLADLRQMTGVELLSEHTTSSEVTEEYTDLQSRLRNLERNETRYLDLLDRADTVADILSVSERLDGVRADIERVQGRINVLDDLTDLATITVTLVAEEAVEEEDDAPPGFVDAWNSAWSTVAEGGRVILAGAAWVSVAAIVLLPVAILGSGLRFAAHRRERPSE